MIQESRISPAAGEADGWWTVALSTEVPGDRPVAAKLGETDLVLFRDADGTIRALLDQCAHRRAPLSLGKRLDSGLVECPYHGWRYDGRDGRCTAIPNLSQDERVPKTYRVPAFAVQESDGFVHVWSQGDATPVGAAPALPTVDLGVETQDAALIAFPHRACIDLLLDAPDAVLAIPGIAIVNQHRFGDPVRAGDEIDVRYAAIPASRRGKGLVSDYPFQVRITVAAGRQHAHVVLTRDGGETIAAARMTFAPVRRNLCAVAVRGSRTEEPGAGPMPIGVRRAIDPATARDAVDYVSRLLD